MNRKVCFQAPIVKEAVFGGVILGAYQKAFCGVSSGKLLEWVYVVPNHGREVNTQNCLVYLRFIFY